MKRSRRSPDCEWLHPENFANEPIYCEAPQNPDDIVYHGSDDEVYASPRERRLCYEAQAQRFLQGKPVFLLSASLRGPFDRESGWVNPWRSKSTSHVKSTRRRRRQASKRDVEQIESSGVFDSSSSQQHSPNSKTALPQSTYPPPRYMDGETFKRVWSWRSTVVAESDFCPSSMPPASQTESTSAASTRATRQTTRRQSGLTLDTRDDETKNFASCVSSLDNNVEAGDESGTPSRKDGQASSPPGKAEPVASPIQLTVSQKYPDSGALQDTTGVPVLDTTPSSPLRASQQSARSVPNESAAVATAVETADPESAPAEDSSLFKVPTGNRYFDETIATPGGPVIGAAAALLRTQPSGRTDGSFRYRRKDARGEGLSRGKSRLADAQSSPSDTPGRTTPEGQPSPAVENYEAPVLGDVRITPVIPAAMESEPVQVVAAVALEIQGQDALEEAPQPGASQSSDRPHDEAVNSEQEEGEDGSSMESASQIDGPTLVPSQTPSVSEHPSAPSFGQFSCDKYSQDVFSEATRLPRKLLWPKSGHNASSGDLNAAFGLDSARSPSPRQPEDESQPRRSGSLNHATPSSENEPEPGDSTIVLGVAEEAQASVRSANPMGGEPVEEPVMAAVGTTAGSETASEAADEEDHGAKQPQVEALADPGPGDDTEPDNQPTPSRPAPEVQSPWVNDGAVLTAAKSTDAAPAQHRDTVALSEPRSSPPQVVQSPWTGEASILPGIPAIPAQLSTANVASARLCSIASQVMDQVASQSPWARGDSQLQAPDVRLFNPLSSPANSHVLPTADPMPHPPMPRDEDIDMCNSQLYPPHPSTPETKQSGLPTPDFTLSVKSFKNFMTPSPQPAAKRRRISTGTASHLLSTQALVEAAISNPWTKPSTTKSKEQKRSQQQPPKPKKYVSWAPLPDEHQDMATSPSPYTAELPTLASTSTSKGKDSVPRRRATSPPPSILATSNLPAATQKFGKHFAAVAGRRLGTTPLLQRLPQKGVVSNKRRIGVVSILPSESQQVCASPAVDAMAERFLVADVGAGRGDGADGRGDTSMMSIYEDGTGTGTGAGGEGIVGAVSASMMMSVYEDGTGAGVDTSMMKGVEFEGDDGSHGGMDVDVDNIQDEEEEGGGKTQEMQDAEEVQVDEVSAVMENLDDFLGGGWDLDAELAKQARKSRGFDGMGGGSGSGMSGLMDIGVWD